MADSQGISSHGCKIFIDGVEIPDVMNITPPALSRKNFDQSIQASDDDQKVMGILRKGPLGWDQNIVKANAAAAGASSPLKYLVNNQKGLFKLLFPDTSFWQCSGSVANFAPKGPVEGGFAATVSVELTGKMTFQDAP